MAGINLVGIPPLTGFLGKLGLARASVQAGTPEAWLLLAEILDGQGRGEHGIVFHGDDLINQPAQVRRYRGHTADDQRVPGVLVKQIRQVRERF